MDDKVLTFKAVNLGARIALEQIASGETTLHPDHKLALMENGLDPTSASNVCEAVGMEADEDNQLALAAVQGMYELMQQCCDEILNED